MHPPHEAALVSRALEKGKKEGLLPRGVVTSLDAAESYVSASLFHGQFSADGLEAPLKGEVATEIEGDTLVTVVREAHGDRCSELLIADKYCIVCCLPVRELRCNCDLSS